MDRLFDETFTSENDNIVSRHIWYGYVELYTEGEYGKDIVLDEALLSMISQTVKNDRSEKRSPSPTETHWYLYGKTKTEDAIGDTIRPTIMVREQQGKFLVRCNISDHDFAMKIDAVLSFEDDLAKLLATM